MTREVQEHKAANGSAAQKGRGNDKKRMNQEHKRERSRYAVLKAEADVKDCALHVHIFQQAKAIRFGRMNGQASIQEMIRA